MKLIISLLTVAMVSKTGIAQSAEENFETLFEDSLKLDKYKQESNKYISEFGRRFPDATWILSQKFLQNSKKQEKWTIIGNDSMPTTESPNHHFFTLNDCDYDLLYLLSSLTTGWGFKMLDSAGKIPSGITRGDFKWPGNFDGCHEVIAPPSKSKLSPNGFSGKYCTLSATSTQIGIQIGLCLPNSCSVEDLQTINTTVYHYIDKIPFVNKWVSKHSPHLEVKCEPDSNQYDTATIVCVVLFSIICAIVVFASFTDLYWIHTQANANTELPKTDVAAITFTSPEKSASYQVNVESSEEKVDKPLVDENSTAKPGKAKDILLCFSVFKNAPSILDTKIRPGQMNCLHGIRFISLSWVILGHTYVMAMAEVANTIDILSLFKTFWFQAIQQATFSVDTFFLLSGFLLTYLFLKAQAPMTVGKWVYFYIHRYIRLTPVYMMMVFITATWWNYMGDGPFWVYENRTANSCTRNWWYNLLYINNFNSVSDMCLGWSWYLANDMQFYIISPLFLIPLKSLKHRVVGLVVIAALLLSSWIATGVISAKNDYPIMFNGIGNAGANASEANVAQKLWDEFDDMYDKPYMRIGPYLIGVLLGFVMHEVNRKQITVARWVVAIGWISAAICNLFAVYGLYNTGDMGTAINSLYNTLARSGWSLGVGWLIFACLTGNGGPVNELLSWNVFFPLSRLTYCAYLVHPMIMYWYFPVQRMPYYFSQITTAILFLGFMCASFGTAFIVSLLFEAPVIKLEKVLREGKP